MARCSAVPRRIWPVVATFLLLLCAYCGSGASARSQPEFSGEAALTLARTQTDFGPRVPGSEAHRLTIDWMEAHLQPLAAVVQRQTFPIWNPHYEESADGANLIASFYPEKTQRIMLCAHFDSRPEASAEYPPVLEPIDGAVDGAAGTAIMLHMAELLSEHEPAYGVDIVLFDGEDTGLTGAAPEYEHWFQGSRHFASFAKQSGYQPWFAILVDLVGDVQADYYQEPISLQYAPDVVKKVWDLAAGLGITQFRQSRGSTVVDDHWILNRDAGIPSIDITESISDYPHWHTREDTWDKLSAESLEAVGRVLVAVLYPQ
ncbi:M28 family peptidase [Candidatus Zixiibacteriota bacterium]